MAEKVDAAKAGRAYVNMKAYYEAIIQAGKLEMGALKEEVKKEEGLCRTANNEKACFAARGLSQILKCREHEKLLKDEKERATKLARERDPEGTNVPLAQTMYAFRAAYTVGYTGVSMVCQGYAESGRAFLETFEQAAGKTASKK